jgi:hypothetical protein
VPNNVRSDRIVPLAPRRFALHVTIDQETQEMIRYAQSLMSHGMPSNDVAEVLKRGLQTLIAALEKRKFAATEQPRPSQSRPDANPRAIPAHVKRAVWRRDQGRCTFVGENGHRCDAREMLEFDHVMPVARGGEATVEGIRLRCRAHNYYEAERVFGAEFMGKRAKREAFAESEAREILGAT